MQYVLINLKVNQGYTDTIEKIMVTVLSGGNVGQAVLGFVCLFVLFLFFIVALEIHLSLLPMC